MRSFLLAAGAVALLSFVQSAAGQVTPVAPSVQVREYDENGLRYRETKRLVQRQVIEMKAQDQQREVQTPKYVTETRKTERLVYSPVVEYQWQPVMRGRWNPFIEPHYEYRLIPVTRWDTRRESVDVPVQYQQMTTQTVTDRVLTPTSRLATEEYITREIVGAAKGDGAAANIAAKPRQRTSLSDGDSSAKAPATAAGNADRGNYQ